MHYRITGENPMGKWGVNRPNKKAAQETAKRKRDLGNRNVRIRKVTKGR